MTHVLSWIRIAKTRTVVVTVFALAIVLLTGLVAVRVGHSPGTTTPPHQTTNTAVVTHTTDRPSESKTAAAAYTWQGGSADPKRIQIPAIGVDTYVQRMDLDQYQEIAAPSNIHLAGWYVRSVSPGSKGLSIIDGHLNGRSGTPGVFDRLDKLQAGDTITITRGDNGTATYHVASVQNVPLADVPNVLFSQDPANTAGQLNLITCSGSYNTDAQRYDHRIVVSAVLQIAE